MHFDSTIESGNLERVEAYPLFKGFFDMKRGTVGRSQKYDLFCKVDTNTKGHQQWFYFKVKKMRTDVKYHFSICNFTKPFSLFKQGMQVQMFSKKRQAKYEKDLRFRLSTAEKEGTELDDELRLLKEKGVIKEVWKPVGMNIKY